MHSGGGKMTNWRPPQKAWKPAGGGDNTRLPYSQPWFRQGQGALDQVVKELREMRALVEIRTTERDHALNMAHEANEMWAAIKAENVRAEEAKREADDAAASNEALANAMAADKQRELERGEQLMRQLAERTVELERAKEDTRAAQAESAAAKKALEVMAQRKADEMASARRAEAELAAAQELANRMEAARAADRAQAAGAEEARMQAQHEADLVAASEEESRRLRAIRAVVVPEDTRGVIEKHMPMTGGKGGKVVSATLGEAINSRYNDPEEIFSLLDGGPSGSAPKVTLVRASWLRSKQPKFLPGSKSDLPPEAIIYASELRKIYRQTKTKTKLLPIVSVLHPLSSPMSNEAHPDGDGTVLGRVIEALDMRWDQFTRKRGTGSDSGVTDLGIFFDWCALEEPTLGRTRTPTAVEDFGLWYAHQLVTVWMLPEEVADDSRRLSFSNGWSAFEYLLATIFKSTSDLSGYTGPWPQLLDLSEHLDFEHNERIHRPPPAEPLVLNREHELGESIFANDDERKVASTMYQKTLFEMLQTSDILLFSKLGWGDVEVARLSLVLPLCTSLTQLRLDANAIGDKGVHPLAEALPSLVNLELLSLKQNMIGDAGASRLAGALTDGALQIVKSIGLNDNHIGDKGALTLASAISGGAVAQCKTLTLTGNPASPMARKSVTKALKKARTPA